MKIGLVDKYGSLDTLKYSENSVIYGNFEILTTETVRFY